MLPPLLDQGQIADAQIGLFAKKICPPYVSCLVRQGFDQVQSVELVTPNFIKDALTDRSDVFSRYVARSRLFKRNSHIDRPIAQPFSKRIAN